MLQISNQLTDQSKLITSNLLANQFKYFNASRLLIVLYESKSETLINLSILFASLLNSKLHSNINQKLNKYKMMASH